MSAQIITVYAVFVKDTPIMWETACHGVSGQSWNGVERELALWPGVKYEKKDFDGEAKPRHHERSDGGAHHYFLTGNVAECAAVVMALAQKEAMSLRTQMQKKDDHIVLLEAKIEGQKERVARLENHIVKKLGGALSDVKAVGK